MNQTVMVSGGAGFIGSTVAAELLASGYRVVVFDNLSKGHRAAVPDGAELVVGDLADAAAVQTVLREKKPTAVLHFAASIEAGESMRWPERFFRNNTLNTLQLLECMLAHGVKSFVFSSTAAVYGNPERTPITENDRLQPTSVYGESKLLVERVLDWYGRIHGLASASLRYFNAAGATAQRGEDHDPESHLIPLTLQVALGKRAGLQIFGSDYPTDDGTCVRDYVHVVDLAAAHVLALQALLEGKGKEERLVFNLGSGKGFSVREVIDSARRITGHAIPAQENPRRPGDPATLIACSDKIRRELGWKPRFENLEAIIGSAWEWHRTHPNGYADK